MFRIGFRKVYYFNIRIISSVFMLENRMKYIYHMVMYVEDAILEKMKNHPSDELGRDLLFVRFFCLKMKSRYVVNSKNWYPTYVEDYISWQLDLFERWKREGKNSYALSKGYGYDIDYLRLEKELNTIVDSNDLKMLVNEINCIWKRWSFNRKYIIPSSAKYKNDLVRWKV